MSCGVPPGGIRWGNKGDLNDRQAGHRVRWHGADGIDRTRARTAKRGWRHGLNCAHGSIWIGTGTWTWSHSAFMSALDSAMQPSVQS